MALIAGNQATIRWAFTTRTLTAEEKAAFLAGGALPAGVGSDPATAKFEYQLPGQGAFTLVEGAGVVREEAGVYHSLVTPLVPGLLLWRGLGFNGEGAEIVSTGLEQEEVLAGEPSADGSSVVSLVNAIVEEGGFDVPQAQALRWLDQRHQLMAMRTKCVRKKLAVGFTVAGQQTYTLPAEVIEIHEVLVNANTSAGLLGVPYGAGRTTDLAQGALGYIWLGGLYMGAGGGIYTRDASGEGADLLALYPTPTESGLAITVRAVCRPAALTLAGALSTPPEFDDALIAGAIATGLERTEARPDLAASAEQKFSAACTELLAQVNRRFRGSGPATIRVAGFNAT